MIMFVPVIVPQLHEDEEDEEHHEEEVKHTTPIRMTCPECGCTYEIPIPLPRRKAIHVELDPEISPALFWLCIITSCAVVLLICYGLGL